MNDLFNFDNADKLTELQAFERAVELSKNGVLFDTDTANKLSGLLGLNDSDRRKLLTFVEEKFKIDPMVLDTINKLYKNKNAP